MDIFQAMNAMQNPQGMMLQYTMQGMIAQHPDMWQKAQEQFNGKSHDEQISQLRELYKSKGMNLDAMARQWGIQL